MELMVRNTTWYLFRYMRKIVLTVNANIQQFNPIPAPGAMETVQVRTMRPLSGTSQANQDTKITTQDRYQ